MHEPTARPRVVIVGAGFGGLQAAKSLKRAAVDVTIVDRRNHHCFQPLLYQVATAALSPADIAWPVRAILSRQKNARVVMAEVVGIDTAARRVLTGTTAPLLFDFLVLATGATHSYFGHDEWAPFAPGLKTLEDATEIRRRLLLAFERAEIAPPAEQKALLAFVIIGGGPTGVELAGAFAEIARNTLRRDFRHIDPRDARIILVEAGERLLPAMPVELGAYAQKSLRAMQVEVLTAHRVVDCDANGIALQSGERIDAGTIVWAAGIRASQAATWLGVAGDRVGRVAVAPDLTVPGHANIFAIGDTAAPPAKDGKVVPGLAPAAKQMGQYVADVIAARVAGEPAPGPFAYRHYGDLATIGRSRAVVSLGRLRLKGFVGWVFWCVAHIFYLIGARSRVVVAADWLLNYLTFQRGARLITRPMAAGEGMRPTDTPPKIEGSGIS